jgi:hypothetical protein
MGLSTCTHGKSTTHTQVPPKEVHERRNWTLIASNPCFKVGGASCRMLPCCQMFLLEKMAQCFVEPSPFVKPIIALVVRASKPQSSKLTCNSLDMGSTLLLSWFMSRACETPILPTYLPCDLPTKHMVFANLASSSFLGLSLPSLLFSQVTRVLHYLCIRGDSQIPNWE